jgi:hypothetical protein
LAPQLKKAIENLYAMSQRAQAKGQYNYIYALCTYCGKEILTPELKVMIGKRLRKPLKEAIMRKIQFSSAQKNFIA